jgi:hypothetical protein
MEWRSMVSSPDTKMSVAERQRLRVRLASLEADAAYFQARMDILGEPETTNQLAQQRVFEVLRKGLEDLILKTKRRMLDEK